MTQKPDVTVAIDFGTTFTGAGFLFPNGTIDILDNWPGNNQQSEQKVPTRLIYNQDNSVFSWGFQCDVLDGQVFPGKRDCRYFKIFLDEDTCKEANRTGVTHGLTNTKEAARCGTDYLRQIYRHLKSTYEESTGVRNWASLTVKFLFSVPTTWRGMEVINAFKKITHDAGFGTEGPGHSSHIDLTEAEAAAVDTLKSGLVEFATGDIFLTVDAGGGTTDLSLVRVTSLDNGIVQISQIAEVNGIATGSTLIDFDFHGLVEHRLSSNPGVLDNIPDIPRTMMTSERFKIIKHHFGEASFNSPVYKVPVPGLGYDFNHTGLRIVEGRMIFDCDEIQNLFDPHVDSIILKIKEQLDWMIDNHPGQQVTRMILSGGLGSSAYVQKRIREHLNGFSHPAARNCRLIPSRFPQTTVVRGLLKDHKQRIETANRPVMATYIARASYGVVVREPYDPSRHFNEEIEYDDNIHHERWAINQIQWVIRKVYVEEELLD
ncbi:hsp70 family chaperone [Fusarium longipes]|uniref:Hsp70 family chaperone n=1 Tax=Fusarium longipes TaxID=694270 RepID=A0A395SW62_9HYPO|nr:hsp70 family chaperone [Fusarium longipes]